jgi:uncharacterized repeat protein (TIGR01451 family)
MAISRARLSRIVPLFLLFASGGVFLLSGCAGETKSGQFPDSTVSATFPDKETIIATKASETPLFQVTPTATDQPQASSADLVVKFTPAIDDGLSINNVYSLTVRNLGPGLATDILITHLFPSGTDTDQIHLLHPICQLQEKQLVCDVGDDQADGKVAVALDLSSEPDHPVINDMRRSASNPSIALPVCSFEQIIGEPLRLICRLESLRPGMQTQIYMQLNPEIEPGIHRFSVAAAQVDPDASNNAGSARVALTPVDSELLPDLTIQATGPAEVIAGQSFTYTYLVSNLGTGQATEVTFDDPIPPGIELNSYAPGLPVCEQKGDTLTCSLVDPDSGEKATFSLTINGNEQQPIRMDVDPLRPGWPLCYVLKEQENPHVLHCDLGALRPGQSTRVRLGMLAIGVLERTTTNMVILQANEPDLAPADNSISTSVMVQVKADLQVHAAPPIWSVADETLSYVIRAVNLGPSDADGSILTGTLPSGTKIVSTNLAPGRECRVETGNALFCNLAYIKSGEMETLSLVLNVSDASKPQNQAEAFLRSLRVVSKAPDPNPDNNSIIGLIAINPENLK